MAATFNDPLIQQVANAISDEARAKYNAAIKTNNRSQYLGLTFWSPNINIFRDPAGVAGMKPMVKIPLTGRIGTAFVKGLQGSDAVIINRWLVQTFCRAQRPRTITACVQCCRFKK
ncbi:MAG: hypothetical protein IPH18_18010 [Chitinophagaceae bacterium]|nr:hypothetical protein [Chitinophagaceae bacterium]